MDKEQNENQEQKKEIKKLKKALSKVKNKSAIEYIRFSKGLDINLEKNNLMPSSVYGSKNLEKEFAKSFICNYLSSCSVSDLKDIETKLNRIGKIKALLNQSSNVNLNAYGDAFVLYIIKNTKLSKNWLLAPFFKHKVLTSLLKDSEYQFSDLSIKYKTFVWFMHELLSQLARLCQINPQAKEQHWITKLMFEQEYIDQSSIELLPEDFKSTIELMQKHITKQLQSTKNSSLVFFDFEDFIKSKVVEIKMLNYIHFKISSYYLKFEKDNILIYTQLDKSDSQALLKSDIINIYKKRNAYDKLDKSKDNFYKKTFELYESSFPIIAKLITEFKKGGRHITNCSICKNQTYIRSKKDKSNRTICTKCTKLVSLLVEIHKEYNKQDIKRKRSEEADNIRHSLRISTNEAMNYCNNVVTLAKKFNIQKAEQLKKMAKSIFNN